MSSRECVQAVISGEQPDRVPLVETSIDWSIARQLIGRDLQLPRDDHSRLFAPAFHVGVDEQLELNQRIGLDILNYSMRPPVPSRRVKTSDSGSGGFYLEGALRSWKDLDQLVFPDLTSEATRRSAQEFLEQRRDYFTVIQTRVGMSATYLAMGMQHFFVTLHDDPKLVAEILGRYTEFSAHVVILAAELGFDAVWSSDDIAFKTDVLWSPAMFREIFWPHMRTFAEAVRETGITWIYHSDGNLWRVLPELVDSGSVC